MYMKGELCCGVITCIARTSSANFEGDSSRWFVDYILAQSRGSCPTCLIVLCVFVLLRLWRWTVVACLLVGSFDLSHFIFLKFSITLH
jgi:hypothetical protein